MNEIINKAIRAFESLDEEDMIEQAMVETLAISTNELLGLIQEQNIKADTQLVNEAARKYMEAQDNWERFSQVDNLQDSVHYLLEVIGKQLPEVEQLLTDKLGSKAIRVYALMHNSVITDEELEIFMDSLSKEEAKNIMWEVRRRITVNG